MKTYLLVVVLFLPFKFAFGQARIDYSQFEKHSKNLTTGRVQLDRIIEETGWIIVSKSKMLITVGQSNSDEIEQIPIATFKEVEGVGHILGFTTDGSKKGFNFIPEDNLILITSAIGGRAFFISDQEKDHISRELKEK